MKKVFEFINTNRNLLSLVIGIVIWRYDTELGRLVLTGGNG